MSVGAIGYPTFAGHFDWKKVLGFLTPVATRERGRSWSWYHRARASPARY
jgi:hypothetical protein